MFHMKFWLVKNYLSHTSFSDFQSDLPFRYYFCSFICFSLESYFYKLEYAVFKYKNKGCYLQFLSSICKTGPPDIIKHEGFKGGKA